jgi:hypothetical protein
VDRDPLKKQRDLHQAEIRFEAIRNHLSPYTLQPEQLKYLSKTRIDAWSAGISEWANKQH